jgi:hypothetical protein
VSSTFDQLAKEILDLLLSALGRLETEAEVPAIPTQRADVFFEPDRACDDARRALGLVGRMTDQCCFFEAFHEAPDVAEVTDRLCRLLNPGAGKTLRRSVAALREAPVGEVRGALLLRMVERHIERRVRGVRTPEEAEEDEVMKGFPLVEAMQREARAEGTLLALERIVERRLHRELSAVEREVLHERLAQLGDRAVDDALDLDAPALDGWLTRAAD